MNSKQILSQVKKYKFKTQATKDLSKNFLTCANIERNVHETYSNSIHETCSTETLIGSSQDLYLTIASIEIA